VFPHVSFKTLLGRGPYCYYLSRHFDVTSTVMNRFLFERYVERSVEIQTSNHPLFVNVVEFSKNAILYKLCNGTKRILNVPNAGGNSIWSEAMSFEIMHTLFDAKLLRTETELRYVFHGCKITDYSMEAFKRKIGVSVTRAMKFRGLFTETDACELLRKKLEGINVSSRSIVKEQAWCMQILHIWAQHPYIALALCKSWNYIEEETKSNSVVIITVTNTPWIFKNQ